MLCLVLCEIQIRKRGKFKNTLITRKTPQNQSQSISRKFSIFHIKTHHVRVVSVCVSVPCVSYVFLYCFLCIVCCFMLVLLYDSQSKTGARAQKPPLSPLQHGAKAVCACCVLCCVNNEQTNETETENNNNKHTNTQQNERQMQTQTQT